MALVATSLDARITLCAQVRQSRESIAPRAELHETVFVDAFDALCEGVEWVMHRPSRGWTAPFTLYFRELSVGRNDDSALSSDLWPEANGWGAEHGDDKDPFWHSSTTHIDSGRASPRKNGSASIARHLG